MAKTIVTHQNPDPDAICSIWLLVRFGGDDYEDFSVKFVPAGSTLDDKTADSDPNVVHVDTGLGKYDHHDTDEKTCAARLVLDDLENEFRDLETNVALGRVVDFITDTDHFGSFFWPEPTATRHVFGMELMLNGFKLGGHGNDDDLVELGMKMLDGAYAMMKIFIEAEEEIEEKGQEFESKWGKALAIETQNDTTMKLALKSGYRVVVKKDPELKHVRIKAAPVDDIDLTSAYEEVKKKDSVGTWFFHSSRHMLLNGSSKNKKQKATPLSLEEVVGILKKKE